MNTTDKFININEDLNAYWKYSTNALTVYAWALRFYNNLEGKSLQLTSAKAATLVRASHGTGDKIIKELVEAGLLVLLGKDETTANVFSVIDWEKHPELALKTKEEYALYLQQFEKRAKRNKERREAHHATKATKSVFVNSPVSVITPEPIILPKTVTVIPVSPPVIVEAEPVNEPIKMNNKASVSEQPSSIPATHKKLSESQLKMYCEITNQSPEHVLNQLEKEPSVIVFILEMLEEKATERRNAERDARTIKNAKAGYEHKGNNPIPHEQVEDAWGGMF